MSENQGGLIKCPDCGGQISPRAPLCPHCGAPQQSSEAYRRMVRLDWGYEWKSQTTVYGIPLVHVAFGRKDGRLRVAKGIIAIGQFALGLITIAQFGVGVLFGFGQFIFGLTVIAQFAVGIFFGLGQFATGYIAIGQFALGVFALGQIAFGEFVWTKMRHDPKAVEFFKKLLSWLSGYFAH